MTETIHTGGGAAVGGNAGAGHDFTGRDGYNLNGAASSGNSSRVDIHTEPYHRADFTSAEILQNLQRAILGNPYNLNEPGMLKSIDALADSMSSLKVWKATVDFERERTTADMQEYRRSIEMRQETTDSRLSSFMVIVWVTLSVVGVEAVALIWLFVQRSVGG